MRRLMLTWDWVLGFEVLSLRMRSLVLAGGIRYVLLRGDLDDGLIDGVVGLRGYYLGGFVRLV